MNAQAMSQAIPQENRMAVKKKTDEKELKVGKNYGLYPKDHDYIHRRARQDNDISDSAYMELLVEADRRAGGKIAQALIDAKRQASQN